MIIPLLKLGVGCFILSLFILLCWMVLVYPDVDIANYAEPRDDTKIISVKI